MSEKEQLGLRLLSIMRSDVPPIHEAVEVVDRLLVLAERDIAAYENELASVYNVALTLHNLRESLTATPKGPKN